MHIRSLALAALAGLMLASVPAHADPQITGYVVGVNLHDHTIEVCNAPNHFVTVRGCDRAAWNTGLAAFSGPEQPGLDRIWTGDKVSVSGILGPDTEHMTASQITVLAFNPNEEYGDTNQSFTCQGVVTSAAPGMLTVRASDGTVQSLRIAPNALVDGDVQNQSQLVPGDVVETYGPMRDGSPWITRVNVDHVP